MPSFVGLEDIGGQVVAAAVSLALVMVDNDLHRTRPNRIGNRSTVRTPGMKASLVRRLTE